MSERTVSENNKLWEAAEKIAEQVVAEKKAESEEERRKQKKRLTKIILMMVLIALIMIFASIAWFAMNKAVTADTMAIEAANAPFEIAVKGNNVRNESEFTKADSTYEIGDSTYEIGNEATYNDDSYYETGGSKQKIKIRYKPVANEATDFGPDSSGVIEFYVIPKQNGTLTVKIDLDTIGFRELGTGNDKTIKRISELTTADITDQDLLASYQTAEQKVT